jgi:hypothetical protein
MRKPLTGEPCAGKLHARFGGRGGLGLSYPYQEADQPIQPGNQVAMPGTMKTATSSNTLIAK